MGQAPVSAIGPVRQHQYIVPSGRCDGTAGAVDKEALSASGDLRSVVGIAWEDADTPSEKRVVVLVERGLTPARGRHMRGLVDDAPCE